MTGLQCVKELSSWRQRADNYETTFKRNKASFIKNTYPINKTDSIQWDITHYDVRSHSDWPTSCSVYCTRFHWPSVEFVFCSFDSLLNKLSFACTLRNHCKTCYVQWMLCSIVISHLVYEKWVVVVKRESHLLVIRFKLMTLPSNCMDNELKQKLASFALEFLYGSWTN